jgi:sugar lactone lactonase YvrE
VRRHRTAADSAQALGTGIGRHRATVKSGAARRGALALTRLSLLALAGLFTATSVMGGQTHPFQSAFTGSDTPAGSLGNTADKVAVRQSNGDVYVIDKSHGVVDTFDGSGGYLSQVGPFPGFGGDPDLAVDNSATASEGNLYVLPEFGPLSAYDSSGTLLYQLNGSTTPIGDFGDVCGTAVDSSGDVYVADYSNQVIQKFDSSGTYLTTINVGFTPCDIAVAADGTIWAIQWNQSLHKLQPDGTDLGVIDSQSPKAVNVDPATQHVYAVHDTSVIEYDPDGNIVSQFGAGLLAGSRGADIDGSTGNVYVSSNPPAGGRVVIFGPLVPVPDVTTGDATNVAETSATLNGHVDPAGAGDITDCHFEYGTDTSYGSSVPCVPATPISSPTDVSADVSGLTPSTIYHFTLVAGTGSAGTVSGGDKTLQTEGPPIVTGGSASNIDESSATLHAAVDPAGFPTTCVFQYVDDASFQATGYTGAASAPCVPADLGSVGGTFVQASADVSGLASSTVYHFRAVATNSAGTTNGADSTFRTAGQPVVTSESATNLTDTTATLNATIIPSGFDTTCVFQYVSDAAFQGSGYSTATSVNCSPFDLGSSFNEQTTSASATGLTPGTIYHFRVVATNTAGTTNGDDTTFETLVSFLKQVGQFGGSGSSAGLFQTPIGVAVDQRGGRVYVVDGGNARIQKFNKKGQFKGAWGYGVRDGQEMAESCKTRTDCQAGVPGSGPGQFAFPTSIAVDSSKSHSKGDVYVGDAVNNVVQKFNRGGKYMSMIDGSTAPQGHFSGLVGVAVDQSGNLWVADAGTGNVVEFNSAGTFQQQWSPGFSPQAIAVDSTNNAVYLINGGGATERFTLTGGGETTIDSGSGTALGLDPQTGNLYVDHGSDVAMYDATGRQIDSLFSLGSTTSSFGLAYYSTGRGDSAGRKDRLYVTDASNNLVTIYGPPGAGAPFITAESAKGAGKTSEALSASIVPLGHKTTCTFEYVDATSFQMSGYTNALSAPCTPADLGSSYTYQEASATLTGLTIGTTYHFHVVATNSAGTSTGNDMTFQAGPGAWTPFSRCPVDDPAMLATDGVSLSSLCVASNSTHGSIKIGSLPPTITGNSNLQGGLVADLNAGIFTFIAPLGGALIADPATVTAGGVTVVATVESAGTPSDFDLLAGISVGMPIVTLPVKIHLVSETTGIDLGPTCYIGSEMDPIVLHPANTDVSNAMLDFVNFDADGTIDPNGAFASLIVSGTTQGDSSFSVPAASGCGPNGDGTFDSVVNSVVGLPAPSGNNLVLEDASSALAIPNNGQNGVEFSAAWHSAFD